MTNKWPACVNFEAFMAEVVSTRNLLGYALKTIREGAFLETTKDPILTLASIGVEKLYKLTLGLITVRDKNQWPSSREMKKYGHKLKDLHSEIYAALSRQAVHSTEFVREQVDRNTHDAVINSLLSVLAVYGQSGRFYYLDQLGGRTDQESPEQAWQELEEQACRDLKAKKICRAFDVQPYDKENGDSAIEALNELIAKALEDIWATIVVCGNNGLLGPIGKTFSAEVCMEAVGRQ